MRAQATLTQPCLYPYNKRVVAGGVAEFIGAKVGPSMEYTKQLSYI